MILTHEAQKFIGCNGTWSPYPVAFPQQVTIDSTQLDVVNLQNTTPLHLAAKADALEVCQLLISHHADKHAQHVTKCLLWRLHLQAGRYMILLLLWIVLMTRGQAMPAEGSKQGSY